MNQWESFFDIGQYKSNRGGFFIYPARSFGYDFINGLDIFVQNR
jgi:hypothetical protein